MNQQFDIFLSSLQAFWAEIAGFAPKLMAALLLLALGWFLARILKAGTRRLLMAAQFDSLAQKSGLEALAQAWGVNISLAGMVGELAYWLVMFVVAVSISNSLGLHSVADLLNRIVLYLPNLLVVILVLLFGTLLARLVNRAVFAWLHDAKFSNALFLSTASEYVTQTFAFFLALEQLGIGTQLITSAFSIAFGGLVFALALAFGLGGRDWAAERIREWTGRKPAPPQH